MISRSRCLTLWAKQQRSSVIATRPFSSKRVSKLGTNVFASFSELAKKHDAINLGQGFPTFGTPNFVKQAAIEAFTSEEMNNQYTRPGGHPQLIESLQNLYSKLYARPIHGLSEIITFTGAQEGIFSIFAALLNEGDEVVILEPYFDAYINAAAALGIKTVGVPLEMSPTDQREFNDPTSDRLFSASELKLDLETLESRLSSKTKMIVLNTPHNPTGKVFSREELGQLSQVLRRYPDVMILSDEVYEFMTFDNLPHERIATMPDMYDRVISLFSAGKTFSCTGWRCGYAIGPARFMEPILKMHNNIPFCGVTPLEVALAQAFDLAQEQNYFHTLRQSLEHKRNLMIKMLRQSKLKPLVPQGGYFVCCDTSQLELYQELQPLVQEGETVPREYPDYRMAVSLCEQARVVTIPTSPFYSSPNKHLARSTIRLAYCKDDATLLQAGEILTQLR